MDKIFEGFLTHQYQEGMALAEASDLLELAPLHGSPPQHYLARYYCKGLTRSKDGCICEVTHFEVGIWFPSDYLRHVDSLFILTWLNPQEIWHPNISNTAPIMCIGPITPGTPLTDLIYRAFEVISWNKLTMRENDALNAEACVWARHNPDRFPVDRRPLKRRGRSFAENPLCLPLPNGGAGACSSGMGEITETDVPTKESAQDR